MFKPIRLICAAFAVVTLAAAPVAFASNVAAAQHVGMDSIDITVISQPTSAVLNDIGSDVGIRIVGGGRITQPVRNARFVGSLDHVMNRLGHIAGFVWYRNNNVVFVSRSDHFRTIAINNPAATPATVDSRMSALGFDPQRWPIRGLPGGGVVVSGPRRYVRIVRTVAMGIKPYGVDRADIPVLIHGPASPLSQP